MTLDSLPAAITVSGGLGAVISLLGVWIEVESGRADWMEKFWGKCFAWSLAVMAAGLTADILREL